MRSWALTTAKWSRLWKLSVKQHPDQQLAEACWTVAQPPIQVLISCSQWAQTWPPKHTHTHHPHYSKTNRWRYKQVFDVQVAALVVVAVMWRLDRFGGWQPLSGRGAVAGLSLTCGCFFFASQFTSQSGLLFYHFTPLNQSSTLQWENSRGFRFGGVYKVSTWYFKNYPTQSWNAMSSRGNKPDDVIVWWMKLSDMLFVVNQA